MVGQNADSSALRCLRFFHVYFVRTLKTLSLKPDLQFVLGDKRNTFQCQNPVVLGSKIFHVTALAKIFDKLAERKQKRILDLSNFFSGDYL